MSKFTPAEAYDGEHESLKSGCHSCYRVGKTTMDLVRVQVRASFIVTPRYFIYWRPLGGVYQCYYYHARTLLSSYPDNCLWLYYTMVYYLMSDDLIGACNTYDDHCEATQEERQPATTTRRPDQLCTSGDDACSSKLSQEMTGSCSRAYWKC